MLHRLTIDGVELPKLYVAQSREDAELALRSGIPYVRWKGDDRSLVAVLLRPALKRLFPDVLWSKVLGKPKDFATVVVPAEAGEAEGNDGLCEAGEEDGTALADVAEGRRTFDCGENGAVTRVPIEEYVQDMASKVNIEALSRLGLLPRFIGDVNDCIRRNLTARCHWTEGYNKKRRVPIGSMDASRLEPNLIILDVSASIPRGISSTMLAMVDTLREQVCADLIVTGGISLWFEHDQELPSPDELRKTVPLGNESRMFRRILAEHVDGRQWAHVISFGDYDEPHLCVCDMPCKARVRKVLHYNTRHRKRTGYAKWVHVVCPNVQEEFDTSWCQVIRR